MRVSRQPHGESAETRRIVEGGGWKLVFRQIAGPTNGRTAIAAIVAADAALSDSASAMNFLPPAWKEFFDACDRAEKEAGGFDWDGAE